jgi:hypothetical protein
MAKTKLIDETKPATAPELEAPPVPPSLPPTPPEAPAAPVLKTFVVRATPPHGDPISYSVRAPSAEAARDTFALSVTEQEPPAPTVKKPGKRFVQVIAAKSAACPAGRKIEVGVRADSEDDAIQAGIKWAYDIGRWESGSVTEARCGDSIWKGSLVTKLLGG